MTDAETTLPAANQGDSSFASRWKGIFALKPGDVLLYRFCDGFAGVLIFLMVLFGPWAFGTTQPWSVAVMNAAGYVLGGLFLLKLFIRELKKYPAARWDVDISGKRRYRRARRLTFWLAWLTAFVLLFCLVSAVNASAVYNPDTRLFTYRHFISWLPHSLDGARSWAAFWMYLGLAASFWAVRDWLMGLTPVEERERRGVDVERQSSKLPARLRWLLWLLCINGAVLGLEAIVQRASGSDKLLFLVQPRINQDGESQFGSYAYRSNAAQYFNLLWPLCLGFWWTLRRRAGSRNKAQHLLLVCAAIMAACPIISSSRASATVAAGMLLFALIFFAATGLAAIKNGERNHSSKGVAIGFSLFFGAALVLGWHYGWQALSARMEHLSENYTNRDDMYEMAKPMARDYPVFGTGPGTFGTVFQLYRIGDSTYWPEQLHNDWLETRITFGWIGFNALLLAFACVGLRWFASGGIYAGRRLVVLLWLSLAGCFAQARFDFPFQVHSIVFLFLVICAMLFSVTQHRE